MPHLPLRKKSDFPEEYRYLLDEEVLGELNLFQVIGHSPEILQSFIKMASTLWEHSKIEEAAREMLTLVVARDLDSTYVWHQHVGIAMDLGVPTDEIRAIGDTEYEAVRAVDELLVEFALAFVRDEVTGEEVAKLQNHHSPGAVVGVAMLANHYVSVANFV
jgi:4-carboxymuconolactone decarboxylase